MKEVKESNGTRQKLMAARHWATWQLSIQSVLREGVSEGGTLVCDLNGGRGSPVKVGRELKPQPEPRSRGRREPGALSEATEAAGPVGRRGKGLDFSSTRFITAVALILIGR